MVKIFVGNLGDDADPEKLKALFEEYGTVTECDILNRFGFVVSVFNTKINLRWSV